MTHETILFISAREITGNSVLAAVKATGYPVINTTSTQAAAFLFIMHCDAVVLLDRAEREKNSFDLARNLRAICHDVPIILLSPTPISSLPSDVDDCVSTTPPLRNLTSTILRAIARTRHRRNSLQQAS